MTAAVTVKIVQQQAVPPTHARHPGVAATQIQQQYAAAPHVPATPLMGVPPGLASRVVGPAAAPPPTPPPGAVTPASAGVVGAPAAQQSVPVAVDGGGGMGVAGGAFCAFCGGRLVAATANFCTYCGQPVGFLLYCCWGRMGWDSLVCHH